MPIIRVEIIDHAGKKNRRIDYVVSSMSRAFEVIDHRDGLFAKSVMEQHVDNRVKADRELLSHTISNNLFKLLEENDTRNGYTKQQLQDMLKDLE